MRRLAAVAAAGLILAPGAHAAGKGPVFGLRAVGNNQLGYFVYTSVPDETETGSVIVSNVGTQTGTVKLFTTDATTGRTTGTVYETNKRPTRAGSWIRLSSTAVRLAPGTHRQVAFTVHVPTGTPPGEWVGGIVAEASHRRAGSNAQHKANVQIQIRDLTIIAVESRVPGRRVTDFRIGQVAAGGRTGFQQLFVHFASKGNVLVRPTGRVSIFSSDDKLVETVPFTMDTFLPRTAIDYPLLLETALGAGDYRATVTLQAPGAGAVTKTRSFSVSQESVKTVFASASPTQAPSSASSSWSTVLAVIAAMATVALIVMSLLFWRLHRRSA
jgi:WxL Interacting Protein, peptidoglycan binding domain